MQRIKNGLQGVHILVFLVNGDFIVPCVMSVLFSMLAAAFLAMVKYGFSTADNFNDSKTGQVFILN